MSVGRSSSHQPPRLTTDTIAAAERLTGLRFTGQERKLLLEGLHLPLQLYQRRRALALAPELAPALRFDPGREREVVDGPFVRSTAHPGPLPTAEEDLAFASVASLSRWLESGELTSERLTRIYLERLSRLGPVLECLVTLTSERALAEARQADAERATGRCRGPLHGIPWGAKDLLDTAGIATTWGAAPYADRVPARDAEVVRRLSQAGAVLVAKLSLGELAQGDAWFAGRTRSPWNPGQGSGGSSAGSGAATAAGLVGFALGSETLGSIANPAMVCGVVGLRPTFGRVPRSGAMTLAWSLDKLGPLCRSVEDAALVLDAIRGAHPGDPDAVDAPFPFDAEAPVSGLRVGLVRAWFEEPWAGPGERAALTALERAGLELDEIELPDLPWESVLVGLQVEAAAAFEELTLSGRDDELRGQDARGWPNAFRLARLVSAVEYVQLLRLRSHMCGLAHDLFREHDLLLGPGMGGVLSFLTNATGHPSLTLRSGFHADGTPAAVTLHARLFHEAVLCRVGLELERRLGVAERRPPLDPVPDARGRGPADAGSARSGSEGLPAHRSRPGRRR